MAAADAAVVCCSPPTRSRLALAAADAVMCVWFASAWVHFAGYAAVSITHAICGEHCRPTEDTAWAVATFAALFSLLPCTIIVRLLCICIEEDPGAEDDDDKVPVSPRSSEAAILEVFAENTAILVDRESGWRWGSMFQEEKPSKKRKSCAYRQEDTSTDYLLMNVTDPGRQSFVEERLL